MSSTISCTLSTIASMPRATMRSRLGRVSQSIESAANPGGRADGNRKQRGSRSLTAKPVMRLASGQQEIDSCFYENPGNARGYNSYFSLDEIAAEVGIGDRMKVLRLGEALEADGLVALSFAHDGTAASIKMRGVQTVEEKRGPGMIEPEQLNESPHVFISHSSKDQVIAKRVVDLLRAALNLRPSEIRCTSVDGHRLEVGADTGSRLRRELIEARLFIGIISASSMSSAWVLFELGARWGAGKPLAPILAPGASTDLLKGPLAALNALSCGSPAQLHQLIRNIGHHLQIPLNSPDSYQDNIDALVNTKIQTDADATENTEVQRLKLNTSAQQGREDALSCDALRLGFRASAVEWAVMLKEKASDSQEVAEKCERMITIQWLRSKKLLVALGIANPGNSDNHRVTIDRIQDEVLTCGTAQHTAFRIGRLLGAAYFGSINQTLALVHTKNAVEAEAFKFPLEVLERISTELLTVNPPFSPGVLAPVKNLWSELLTKAQQGNSEIEMAEQRMDGAIEEVCGLIMGK